MSALLVGESIIHLEINRVPRSERGASGGYAPKEANFNRPLTRVGKDLQEICLSITVCRQVAKRFTTNLC